MNSAIYADTIVTLVSAGFDYEWVMFECPVRVGLAFALIYQANRIADGGKAIQLWFAQLGSIFSKKHSAKSVVDEIIKTALSMRDGAIDALGGGLDDESEEAEYEVVRRQPGQQRAGKSGERPRDEQGRDIRTADLPDDKRSPEWLEKNQQGVDALAKAWSSFAKGVAGMPPSLDHAMVMWHNQGTTPGVPPVRP